MQIQITRTKQVKKMAKCYNTYTPISMCACSMCILFHCHCCIYVLFWQHEYIGLDDHGSSRVQCGYQVLEPKQPQFILRTASTINQQSKALL